MGPSHIQDEDEDQDNGYCLETRQCQELSITSITDRIKFILAKIKGHHEYVSSISSLISLTHHFSD